MSRWRFRDAGTDSFEVRLPADEALLISSLATELGELLEGVATAPRGSRHPGLLDSVTGESLSRLSPPAYPRDPDAEATFQANEREILGQHRHLALNLLGSLTRTSYLTEESLSLVLGAVNDLRLVLGAVLGVSEEEDWPDESDPELREWLLYGYLSGLASEIVDVLSATLPTSGEDPELPEDPWGEPPGDLRWDGTLRPEWPPRPE